ncbi:MAG: glycosyltransferase family 39 protein, partial [Gemmataceae bacterium]
MSAGLLPEIRPHAISAWVIWSARAVSLIAAASLVNLVYVALLCPHDLSPDEAHYWDWSRHLDWCYYSKGPLVAWLIRGSCELFGTTAFAVRLPAVACGGLLLVGLWRLALNTFH